MTQPFANVLAVPAIAVPVIAVPVIAVQIAHQYPLSLINAFIENLKELKTRDYLTLPIKKIKGLGVSVIVQKRNKGQYALDIDATEFDINDGTSPLLLRIIYNREKALFPSEENFMHHVIENVLHALKNIEIDKINGKFITQAPPIHPTKMDTLWYEFFQEFKEDESIQLELNECCVCFTLTKTSTNCRHAVCLECIGNLNTEQEEPDDDNGYMYSDYKNCPMCRQRIMCLM